MSINNQHKSGYKHTPLGWIPEEWEVVPLKQLCQITSSKRILAEEYCQTGIPFYRSKEVIEKINGIPHDEILFISNDRYEKILQRFGAPVEGDILMTAVGSLGKAYVVNKQDLPFYFKDGNLLWFKDFTQGVNKQYLISYFNSILFKKEIELSTYGSSQKALTIETLNEFEVPIPPPSEKNKITDVLSTWDEGITKIQQLIAQLQQRNKGLMQQLLTGKKRLKGFEGEWKKLHATDIFKGVSVKNNGTERLLSATQDRGIIPRDILEARVTMPTGETGSFKLVEIGDFVISLRSFQGGIEYSEYRGLVSPAYTVLKPTKSISTSFFKHYFKSYDFIGHLAVAVIGIRDGKQVSYEDFSILKLPYPDVKEQEAIGKVLDDAVGEVRLYEQKFAALQQQKKGLMQKLLTGEVRVKIDNNQN